MRSWRISGLRDCINLKIVTIVIPVNNIVEPGVPGDKMGIVARIINQLPSTVTTLSLVFNTNDLAGGQSVDSAMNSLNWSVLRRGISNIRRLLHVRAVLNDPGHSPWPDDALRDSTLELKLANKVDLTYRTTV